MAAVRSTTRIPEQAPPAPRRSWGRRAALLLGLLVVLWLSAAAFSLVTARGHLETGRAEAIDGRDLLVDGDAAAAASAFARSERAFATADGLLSSPVVRPLGVLAVVHEDLRTVRGLARAGRLVAQAAEVSATAVADLPGGLAALGPSDGRLPVGHLAALAGPLAESQALLGQARAEYDATPSVGLAGAVASARAELGEQLATAEDLVGDAAAATSVLPAFLGADGPRHYFFAASTPAELRGTGGYLGSYTILTVDDGRLSFGQFAALTSLPPLPVADVPPPSPDFARRYNRYGGAAFWQNINFTPHFPWAASAIEQLWQLTHAQRVEQAAEAAQLPAVDGTIVVDPFAFASLLDAQGTVEVPGIGPVGPDGIVEVVANEAYGAFDDEDQRKAVLGAVAAGALQSLLGQGAGDDAVPLLTRLARTAAEGHVLVHSAHPEEQEVLERLGVAGAVPGEGDLLGVIANQAAASKVDYYVERAVEASITLTADGGAVVDGRVSFANDAPSEGLPKRVIGPNADGLSAGDDQFFLSLYCGGPDCQLESFTPSSGGPQPRAEPEAGRTAYATSVRVRSGSTEQVAFRWRRDQAWQGDQAGGSYELNLLGQTTIRPTRVRLQVQLPPGTVLTAGPPDAVVTDGTVTTVTWSDEVARLERLRFDFAPPPEPEAPESLLGRIRRLLSEPLLRFGMFAQDRAW